MKKFLFSSFLLALFAIGFTASDDEIKDDPALANISLSILKPTTALTYVTGDDVITISGTAEARNGLESITYTTSTGLAGVAEGLENWSIKDLPLGEGITVISVVATDKTGLFKTQQLTVTQGTLTGIVKISEKMDIWDGGYLTPIGYFTYKKDVNTTTEGNFSAISYMSLDKEEMATLIATKDENLPTQLVVKDKGIIYFSFPNDEIVELLFDNGEKVAFLGSYACPKNLLPSFTQFDKEDVFRGALANAAAIIRANTGEETISPEVAAIVNTFADLFEQVSKLEYEENAAAVARLNVTTSGNYEFAEILGNWFNTEIIVRVYNTLALWTGKASFKVGGSSCTLSGTIWCLADVYNALGTYGIVCDTDKAKLLIGEDKAEYQGEGYQPYGKLSFDVDFRGLKPNTTYYYRAYYAFNNFAGSTLVPRNGEVIDNVLYDTTIKSFTTGDNLLSVDVVMCIDYTGSMSGIINTVKENAMSFYDSFKAKCDAKGIGLTGLTAQVIGFQDINVDGDDWFRQSPTYQLPDQREEFNTFVGNIYAMGGGDTPESGLEALDAAFSKTDWGVDDGYHRQVVILWTDAPYLVGEAYTKLTVEGVKAKWDAMPSGRRMVLFAPTECYDWNGGSWSVMDSWKNVIRETNLYAGFSDMDYILEALIGELTSKAPMKSPRSGGAAPIKIIPTPNN
ncbi:MAG: VWA domain-containing protein [Prevotella sp.]|jgi:hypothetical protein|nr:VWA domain-containing protein [Prevotella sp.]